MDLEEAADQLYAISPDEFVERRTALAAGARLAKDRALAKEIGQLRRPTRSAWLVNIVARAEPKRMTELLELGTALQQAQQRMAGDDLRRLSKERRALIDALSRRASELGIEQGYAATDAALQEVSQTLQAALADPEVADLVRAGRVHQAANYGGFGPADLSSALAASLPAEPRPKTPSRTTADEHGPTDRPTDTAEVQAAEQEAAVKRQAAEQAAEAAADAESAAEAATARADDLADEVESLRTRLRETEDQERSAREEARTARKRSTELRREAAATAHAASAATDRLDQLRQA